jgi:hypothetical protein
MLAAPCREGWSRGILVHVAPDRNRNAIQRANFDWNSCGWVRICIVVLFPDRTTPAHPKCMVNGCRGCPRMSMKPSPTAAVGDRIMAAGLLGAYQYFRAQHFQDRAEPSVSASLREGIQELLRRHDRERTTSSVSRTPAPTRGAMQPMRLRPWAAGRVTT